MKLELGLIALVLFALTSLSGCIAGPSCNDITSGGGTPSLIFSQVPKVGTFDALQGRVSHVVPSQYYVAVYIHVGSEGWWVKPTFSDPQTSINCDGTWTADITTGGDDAQADSIAAFLIEANKGFSPPLLSGESTLPQTLYANSVANAYVTR